MTPYGVAPLFGILFIRVTNPTSWYPSTRTKMLPSKSTCRASQGTGSKSTRITESEPNRS
ncbi:MAG TPA: hypothetical protein VH559_15345 [Gemmatimonadaceae bacterium]